MADIQEWHQGQELLSVTAVKRCRINVSIELEKWGQLHAHAVHPHYPACPHQPLGHLHSLMFFHCNQWSQLSLSTTINCIPEGGEISFSASNTVRR
jgi:hypothetical protein